MFIALTGTPGTGKTSLSQQMRMQDINVIDFHDFALKHHCDQGYDAEKDTLIIDIDKVNKALASVDQHDDSIVIEGHLSHLLDPIEKVIILRCHPKILFKRLQQKGWKRQKIRENLESELLDIILCETMETYAAEDVFELDTSNQPSELLVSMITQLIKNDFTTDQQMKPGHIDWSDLLLDTTWMEENNGS
ncbi:MAG: adenylate kinase family protein [Thermoplasmatota archaeon]